MSPRRLYATALLLIPLATAIPLHTVNADALGVNVTYKNTIISQQGTTSTYIHTSNTTQLAKQTTVLNDTLTNISNTLYQHVSNTSYHPVNVTRRLDVYRITTVYDNVNAETFVTKKTLAVTPRYNHTLLYLLETPSEKSLNNTVHYQTPPDVDGPSGILWKFHNVTADTEYNVTYYTDTILVGNEGTNAFSYATDEGNRERGPTRAGREDSDIQLETTFKPLRFETYTDYILKGSTFVFTILLLGIIGFELETKGKLRGVKDFTRDVVAITKVGFRNKRLIEDYIQNCLRQGHHAEDIRQQLLRAGWDRTAVRYLMNKY